MTGDPIVLVSLCGAAFTAGSMLTLTISERTMSARERRQACRQRELGNLSRSVEQRLRLLAVADQEPTAGQAETRPATHR